MNLLSKLNPAWILRLGLGLMYAFSAHDIFFHPRGWLWAIYVLPQSFQGVINQFGIVNFLKIQAVAELTMAVLFLAFLFPVSRLNSRWLKVGTTLVSTVFFSVLYYIIGQSPVPAFITSVLIAAIFIPIAGWFEKEQLIRFIAALAALEMALILWLVGVDAITFRDIGVLGAALALAAFYSR